MISSLWSHKEADVNEMETSTCNFAAVIMWSEKTGDKVSKNYFALLQQDIEVRFCS